MNLEIETMDDALTLMANMPLSRPQMRMHINSYRWFIRILEIRFDEDLLDTAGCLDSELL